MKTFPLLLPSLAHLAIVTLAMAVDGKPEPPAAAAEKPARSNAALQGALRDWRSSGGDLGKALAAVPDESVNTPSDAAALVNALRKAASGDAGADRDASGDVSRLAVLFLTVRSRAAHDYLDKNGIGILREWVSGFLAKKPEGATSQSAGNGLNALRVLVGYRDPAALELVVGAARRGFAADDFAWESLLGEFDEDHPQTEKMFAALADPLPKGFIAVALLDAANQTSLKKPLKPHPFDSEEGAALMKEWLTDTDKEKFGYAYSSAVGLAFLKGKRHVELFELARKHPDPDVRLEAAWADVKSGSDAGLTDLVAAARDPNLSALACEYLEELGHESKIPAEAKEKHFAAKSEMIRWLKHPNELGAPPASIELFDTRELYWPPAGEKRQLWLFKFSYRFKESEPFETAFGMVGNMTWAFFTEEEGKPDPSAQDLYARHCALELERKAGKNTRRVTPEQARALLREKNPGAKF